MPGGRISGVRDRGLASWLLGKLGSRLRGVWMLGRGVRGGIAVVFGGKEGAGRRGGGRGR